MSSNNGKTTKPLEMDKEEVPNVGKKREEEETGIPLESVISSLNFNRCGD
jgi:hypothetical protein